MPTRLALLAALVAPVLLAAVLLAACQPVVAPDSREACAYQLEATLPIRVERGFQVADVAVNGKTLRMLIDTGAAHSVLFGDAPQQVGARTDWGTPGTFTDVNRMVVRHNVVLDRVNFAGQALTNVEMAALPRAGVLGSVSDGVIGMDILRRFDLDFEVPERRIMLYHWRDCPNGYPNWSTGYATLKPLQAAREDGLIVVPGTLDGQPASVVIDSGAEVIVVAEEAALRSGVPQAALVGDGRVSVSGAGSQAVPATLQSFRSLIVGGVAFEPVRALVFDEASRVADVILGYPLFSDRRVWISPSSNRVYVAEP